ncbi:MFS transporter [Streptomyces sp. XM83C]|jgi:MFS family permease|uniref:MFS transporter n=1 Tax=unclassified Streptomyces TaxID=2593676 RepID=UPI001FF7D7A2|nr:MFS transporter [Streptomyces sp. XM83C]MCK1820289.1 MFS transporter [Streptomyces sp. XM83C]
MHKSISVKERGVRGRRNGDLGALLTAVAVGALGEAMMLVAVPWFVLRTTGSVTRTGIVVAAVAVGTAATGLVAGPLVDRWGFRAMAVASYAVGGAAAACIPLLHSLGMLHFPALTALVLAASLLDVPGAAAVTGLTAGLAEAAGTPLERANALLGGVHQTAHLLGAPLGGAAVGFLGADSALLFDAGACAVAALVIACRVPAAATPAGPRPAESYVAGLRAGLRTLRGHRLLRTLTVSSTVFNALDSGISGVILVTYAYRSPDGPAQLGLLLAAFGVGTVAGTLGFAAVGHRFGRRAVYLRSGLLAGLLLAAFATLPPVPVGAALLAVLGAVAAPVGPVRTAALQRHVPQGQYGRVTASVDTLAQTAVPLGASATVALVGGLGLSWAVLAVAAVYLTVVACCWAAPGLRDL